MTLVFRAAHSSESCATAENSVVQTGVKSLGIESGILSEEELLQAAAICTEKEVDFVKTSTGFNGKGASIKAVKMLRNVLPESIGIKASGGIKDLATAEKMLMAGATRIGTSSGFDILGL